ncbi:class I mannose-6-phosphate isomerase [Sphingomonas sabuli]|uniref:Class I mannose-6-phosphate isomerase n=1 Tax=Sphingomonas sabuli TaxID=2764186 RepID=A0A7G9L5V7_9SPHN|nr:class I mannose-6-phosphate isomerase [Sphingomonas sabuli]
MDGRVPGRLVEKPWGRDRLPPPFDAVPDRRIGEIWFPPPPGVGRLLAKYLFTSQKVSVQAHATDEQTLERGIGRQGKDECWLILHTEPGAALGVGLREPVEPDSLRRAATDGSIEDMLVWYPVEPGDFFYIPANTIHAIGAGVTLLEVEQNSDLTYRLYDYGRPRDLHLDDGLSIARGEPYPEHLHRKVPPSGEERLVDGPHFRAARLDGPPSEALVAEWGGGPVLIMPLSGDVEIAGERVAPGQCGAVSQLGHARFLHQTQAVIAQAIAA